MPLLAFWKSDPASVLSMSIDQIVAAAGDGKLRDESDCSAELRSFLTEAPTDTLRKAAEHCLANSFNKSGQVLQDIVNELGRRLDFTVVNGRYSGTTNAVGNDGLWHAPDGHDIIVEVKTTDAYRVSLDTIAKYRDALLQKNEVSPSHSMLVVVGRDDTGELEAQVRGSRHAWDMRLISVDSLIRLLEIKEATEETETANKIRSILKPAEYTRLDALIDVLFTAAKDVEDISSGLSEILKADGSDHAGWDFTAPDQLAAKRQEILTAVSKSLGRTLVQKTRATFWDAEKTLRAVCTLSKRYDRQQSLPYWYAYHPAWDDFLSSGVDSVVILGAMDIQKCFVIPHALLKSRLGELNTTSKEGGKSYWHVKIIENPVGQYFLQMPKSGNHVPLEEYAIQLQVE